MMEKRKFWKALKSGEFAAMIMESARGQVVSSSEEICNVMKPLFADAMDVERMYGIFLNTKNRIIAIEKIAEGTINHTVIYPRELLNGYWHYVRRLLRWLTTIYPAIRHLH